MAISAEQYYYHDRPGLELYLKRSAEIIDQNRRVIQCFIDNPPLQVPIGRISSETELAIKIALALSILPRNQELSHCCHRAVIAVLAIQLAPETKIDLIPQSQINAIHLIQTIGQEKFMFIIGYNNWWALKDPLNCKIMPGLPLTGHERGVRNADLVWLDTQTSPTSLSEIDASCPKRTLGIKCNIMHGEEHALLDYIWSFEKETIPPSKSVYMACTWPPCKECFKIVAGHPEIFPKNSGLFIGYRAFSDPADRATSRGLFGLFESGLFQRPLIDIYNQNPGYGWQPALNESLPKALKAREASKFISKFLGNEMYLASTFSSQVLSSLVYYLSEGGEAHS